MGYYYSAIGSHFWELDWPGWIIEKYPFIDFDKGPLRSNHEAKRLRSGEFANDVQRAVLEATGLECIEYNLLLVGEDGRCWIYDITEDSIEEHELERIDTSPPTPEQRMSIDAARRNRAAYTYLTQVGDVRFAEHVRALLDILTGD